MSTLLLEDQIQLQVYSGAIGLELKKVDAIRDRPTANTRKELDEKAADLLVATTKYDTLVLEMRDFVTAAKARYDTYINTQKATQLSSTPSSSAAPVIPSQPTAPARSEVTLKDPDAFTGSTTDYRRWVFECKNVMSVRTSLDSDARRVTWMGTLMKGAAFEWYQLWIASATVNGVVNFNYQQFLTDLDVCFRDPTEQSTYRKEVRNAHQGNKPFNDYAIHFMNLCNKANLDVNTQIETFIDSLNRGTIEHWNPQTMPNTYSEVVGQIHTIEQVHKSIHQRPASNSPSPSSSPRNNSGSFVDDGTRPGPFYSNPSRQGYKDRLAKGWCTRCGLNSHSTEKCHVYPHNRTNNQNYEHWSVVKNGAGLPAARGLPQRRVNFNNIVVKDNNSELEGGDNTAAVQHYLGTFRMKQLPSFLVDFLLVHPTTKRYIQGRALIDSGASKSLIGKRFSDAHQIPTSPLRDILSLTLADGKTSRGLTHQTDKVTLTVNNLSHTIQLPTFEMKYDVILGLDWLQTHNPAIDWPTLSLKFSENAIDKPDSIDNKPARPIPRGTRVSPQGSQNQCCAAIEDTDPANSETTLHATTPLITPGEAKALPSPDWPMSEYPRVFDMDEQRLLPPHRENWDFDVVFKEGTPLPKNRPGFKLPPKQLEAAAEWVSNELKSGKIRVSNSRLAANLFFVPKNDSTTELRPCIDYRDLNDATIDDRYPLPPLSILIRQLAGGDWYSKLDLRWGYHNVRIKAGSEWKFAFKCHLGLFEPLVMPFGPKQAPSHMQRFVREHCKEMESAGWLHNILDDFVIKTTGSVEDHKTHIRIFLQTIENLGCYVKESK